TREEVQYPAGAPLVAKIREDQTRELDAGTTYEFRLYTTFGDVGTLHGGTYSGPSYRPHYDYDEDGTVVCTGCTATIVGFDRWVPRLRGDVLPDDNHPYASAFLEVPQGISSDTAGSGTSDWNETMRYGSAYTGPTATVETTGHTDSDASDSFVPPFAEMAPCIDIDLGGGLCITIQGTTISLGDLVLTPCSDIDLGGGLCVTIDDVETVVVGLPTDLILVACADLGLGCDGYRVVDPAVTVARDIIAVSVSCTILLDFGAGQLDPTNLCDPTDPKITHISVSCTIVLNLNLGATAASTCSDATTTPTVPTVPPAPTTPVDNGGGFPTLLAALAGLIGLLLFFAWKRSKKCIHCGEKVKTVEGAVVDSEGNTVC
ncbi:MAG: hypothetical protein GY911_13340, partial [Actinomycetales bacterium]|nr:hypothetical protein [Actinomycetales bacterium]